MREGGADPNDRARGETGRDGRRADHLYASTDERDMMLLSRRLREPVRYENQSRPVLSRDGKVLNDDDGDERNVGHAGWRSIDACLVVRAPRWSGLGLLACDL